MNCAGGEMRERLPGRVQRPPARTRTASAPPSRPAGRPRRSAPRGGLPLVDDDGEPQLHHLGGDQEDHLARVVGERVLEMGEDVRLDVVLVRGGALRSPDRGVLRGAAPGSSTAWDIAVSSSVAPGSGPLLPVDGGAPVPSDPPHRMPSGPTVIIGEVASRDKGTRSTPRSYAPDRRAHARSRAGTPGRPATPPAAQDSVAAAVGELSLQEGRAALVLLLLADRLRGAGEGVQRAQEAAVRLVLERHRAVALPAAAAQRVQAAVVAGTGVGVRLDDPAALEGVVGELGPGQRGGRVLRGDLGGGGRRRRAARAAPGRRAGGSGAGPREDSREWSWVPVCLVLARRSCGTGTARPDRRRTGGPGPPLPSAGPVRLAVRATRCPARARRATSASCPSSAGSRTPAATRSAMPFSAALPQLRGS